MESQLCSAAKHQVDPQMFCEDCQCLVCVKCISKAHPAHLVCELEEKYNEIKTISISRSNFELLIDQRLKEKEKLSLDFRERIENPFNSHSKSISDTFREIHSSLQIKEYELKRELQSLYDENNEIYVTELSRIDTEIHTLNRELNELELITNSDNDMDYHAVFKIWLDIQTSVNSAPKPVEYQHNVLEFDDLQPHISRMRISPLKPLNGDAANKRELYRLLIVQQGRTYLIDLRDFLNITFTKSKNDFSSFKENIENQNVFFDNKIYLVEKGVVKYYDILERKIVRAATIDKFAKKEASKVSTILLNGFIYFFGGSFNNCCSDRIYQYNLKTGSLVKVGRLGFPGHSFSLDAHSTNIYIFGGFGPGGILTKIQIFDTKTNKIIDSINTGLGIKYGFYSSKNERYFLVKGVNEFCSYFNGRVESIMSCGSKVMRCCDRFFYLFLGKKLVFYDYERKVYRELFEFPFEYSPHMICHLF